MEIIFKFFSVLCHQFPDRSFHIVGAQLPICARCAGLYTGMFIAGLYVLFSKHKFFFSPGIGALALIVCAILLSLGDYAFAWFFKVSEGMPDYPRYILGLFSGSGVILLILTVIAFIQLPVKEHTKSGYKSVLIIFALCVIAIPLPLIQMKLIWWLLTITFGLGSVLYYASFNYIPFAIGLRLLNYTPTPKANAAIATLITALVIIEYILLFKFYDFYVGIYGRLHNLLEI